MPGIHIGIDPARPGSDQTAFVFMSTPTHRRPFNAFTKHWVEDPDPPLEMVRGEDGVWAQAHV